MRLKMSVDQRLLESNATGIQKAVAAWRAAQERHHQRDQEFNRRAERASYRLRQEKKGLTVRPYTRQAYDPKLTEEDHEEYERRKHRDRERARRGVTAERVRSWTDLSALTPEQTAAHKRAQAAARKRRQRANE